MKSPPSSSGKLLLHQELSDQHFTIHLTRSLEKAVQERHEATPEPEFDNDESEENHKYPCEQLHKHFLPHLLERYRWRIDELEYWKREATHYKDIMTSKALWNTAIEQSIQGAAAPTTAEGWRGVVGLYQDTLRELGHSNQQIEQLRLSIDSQDYWKTEKELLEPLLHLQEYQLIQQWRKEAERKKRRETARVGTNTKPRSSSTTHAHVGKRRLRSRRPSAKPSSQKAARRH